MIVKLPAGSKERAEFLALGARPHRKSKTPSLEASAGLVPPPEMQGNAKSLAAWVKNAHALASEQGPPDGFSAALRAGMVREEVHSRNALQRET